VSEPRNGITAEDFDSPTGIQRGYHYLIECRRNLNEVVLWWKPEEKGYTVCLPRAGIYTYEEAKEIAPTNRWDVTRPWPVHFADKSSKMVVLS